MDDAFLGKVIRAQSRRFTVAGERGTVPVLVPKRLRFENPDWVDPVAVGDEVEAVLEHEDAVIRRVLPRRNQLARRALGGTKRQLLAANVDRVLIVLALRDPEWKPATLDRYLVLASAHGIPPLVWLNKADLAPDSTHADLLASYETFDIPILRGSASTGAGVDALLGHLAGITAILIGPSGVGKSSLVNRLVPTALARVGEVSASTGKGMHVTSWIEMHDLPGGGHVIDGPGLRTLDLSDVRAADLWRHFPEIRELESSCRFPDCAHMAEPDCAVKDAAASGGIAPERYDSYRRIYESLVGGQG